MRFFTAAALVTQLEEAQKQYQLDRLLAQLDRVDLLICDELGYLSFSRAGAELLFQVFADGDHPRHSLAESAACGRSGRQRPWQACSPAARLVQRNRHAADPANESPPRSEKSTPIGNASVAARPERAAARSLSEGVSRPDPRLQR